MKKPPIFTGQRAQVLEMIRRHQPILSHTLTADHAIPEVCVRIHELRRKGFNVLTDIKDEFTFRGKIRKRIAAYSMGVHEWSDLSGEVD